MLKLVTQRAGGTHPGRVVVRPPRIRAHSLHASDLSWWLIRPSRGRWMLDEAGLDALDLSPDVMDLSQSRRARSVCGLDGAVVAAGVADAVGHGLVEPCRRGASRSCTTGFREALLGGLDQAARREIHQRTAEGWERRDGGCAPTRVRPSRATTCAANPTVRLSWPYGPRLRPVSWRSRSIHRPKQSTHFRQSVAVAQTARLRLDPWLSHRLRSGLQWVRSGLHPAAGVLSMR